MEQSGLIHEAKNGEPEAFARIYERHHPVVYRYLLYRLGDPDSAEDLAGDVFVRLAESIDEFTPQDRPLENWLYQLADTLCEQEYGPCKLTQGAEQATGTEGSSGLPPLSEHMLEAIGGLPEDQKQVILLKFVEGLEDETIADTLGHNTSTIQAMQWVALTTLAKMIAATDSSVDEEVIQQILDDGLANLAHELRTPLSLIQGYTELLLHDDVGPVAPKQRELLQLIYDRAKRIGDLVHTLTALQMIPRGSLSLAQMSPRDWLEETIRDFQLAAGQVGIELRSHIPEHLPSILGDQEHLNIALSQILDNAIKFSPDGGRVDIEAWTDDYTLYVRVRDHGVGIEPQYLDRIFDQFYQTDSSSTRQFGGAGLGLALVKAVVEAHGGWVRAESDGPGQGSTFTLAIPIDLAKAAHTPVEPSVGRHQPSPALYQALDDCLSSLGPEGATLENCLARYPEYVDELKPLLQVALRIRGAPRPAASHGAFVGGRQRMLDTVKNKRSSATPRTILPGLLEQWTVIRDRVGSLTLPDLRPALQPILATTVVLTIMLAMVLFVRGRGDDVIDRTASLFEVEGVAEVLPNGGETWQLAPNGYVIEPGDRIRTGPTSRAMLKLFDGSVAALQNQTELTIARMEARRDGFAKIIVLHQWIGETHHRVEPLSDQLSRFQIETCAAIAAVRGTEFTINVEDDGATQVRVLEGLVRVTAQNVTVDVNESQETSVTVREAPLAAHPISIPVPIRLPKETPPRQPEELARLSPAPPSPTVVEAKTEVQPSPEPAYRKPPRSASSEKTKEPREGSTPSSRSTEDPPTSTPSPEPIQERPRPTQERPKPTAQPTTPGPRPTLPSADVPTPSPTSTSPPAPTDTPTPTLAPTLVPTGTPTATATSTPTPVPTTTPTLVATTTPSPATEATPISSQGSDETPTPTAATATPVATSTPAPP